MADMGRENIKAKASGRMCNQSILGAPNIDQGIFQFIIGNRGNNYVRGIGKIRIQRPGSITQSGESLTAFFSPGYNFLNFAAGVKQMQA